MENIKGVFMVASLLGLVLVPVATAEGAQGTGEYIEKWPISLGIVLGSFTLALLIAFKIYRATYVPPALRAAIAKKQKDKEERDLSARDIIEYDERTEDPASGINDTKTDDVENQQARTPREVGFSNPIIKQKASTEKMGSEEKKNEKSNRRVSHVEINQTNPLNNQYEGTCNQSQDASSKNTWADMITSKTSTDQAAVTVSSSGISVSVENGASRRQMYPHTARRNPLVASSTKNLGESSAQNSSASSTRNMRTRSRRKLNASPSSRNLKAASIRNLNASSAQNQTGSPRPKLHASSSVRELGVSSVRSPTGTGSQRRNLVIVQPKDRLAAGRSTSDLLQQSSSYRSARKQGTRKRVGQPGLSKLASARGAIYSTP